MLFRSMLTQDGYISASDEEKADEPSSEKSDDNEVSQKIQSLVLREFPSPENRYFGDIKTIKYERSNHQNN